MDEDQKGYAFACALRKLTDYYTEELEILNMTMVGILHAEAQLIINNTLYEEDEVEDE